MKIILYSYLLIITTVSKYAFAGPIGSSIMGNSYNVTPVEANAVIDAAGNAIDTVGLLVGKFPPAREYHCTASMITTNNGNVALTAGHCLYDPSTRSYPIALDFYPGFDRVPGTAGGGKVPVAKLAVLAKSLISNNPLDDYGMIKLAFQGRLQDVTGSFGWNVHAPPKNPTTVFGYPESGNMPCKGPRDGNSFCEWDGQSVKTPALRLIPTIDVGGGGSGGPWLTDFDKAAETGTIIGVSSVFVKAVSASAAATWNSKDFNDMLNYIENA